MSNTIKIRRGSGVPTASDFAAYELAYDYTGNDLYVKVGTNMVKVNSEGTGTVTNVVAGNGLTGGGTVTATLDLDFSELTDMTGDISGTTEFILQNGTVESRKAASEIKLSYFNNDSNWTSNAGTVTSIATGTGLTGGTITGSGTISLTNHSGNLITSGTVAAARIASLPASKITTGAFDIDRLPTAAVTNGDFDNVSTANAIYDFVTGQGYLTSVPNHSASLITSGTLNNARLNTDMQLSSAAPRYKLQETGVTNTPVWWMIADGGNYSIRLNNTGNYPMTIVTNGENNAVSNITLGYSTSITGSLNINNRFTSTGNGGFTIGNYSGYDRIQNSSNSFSFLTDGNGYANMTFGTVTAGTWNGSVIASAYLDPDTAHLSGTQTFSGTKTFSDSVRITGGTKYLYLDNDDESLAGLWFRDNQDPNGQYAKIFFNSGGSNPLSFYVKSSTAVLQLASSTATVNGNIAVTGTVDGRDVASDGSKLDGIESGATADQTITLTGDVTGSGTGSFATTIVDDSHNHSWINSNTGDPGDSRLQYWQASGNTTLNPDSAWYTAIRMGHGDPVTYYSNTLAIKMTGTGSGTIYTRNIAGGTAGNWFKYWHDGNDGSTSGLDADLLDGVHASSFLRSDATDTATGALTLGTQTWNGHITWNNGQNIYVGGESSFDVSGSGVWQVWDSGTGAPFIKCDVGQQTEIGQAGSRGLKVHGNSFINGQLQGGFGAQTTGGTTDWNHSTNARSGNGHTLLLATATNGPGTTTINDTNNQYYHLLNFEYAGYDSDGNMTQIGIPYSIGSNPVRPVFRTRYGGTWSSYRGLVTANANGQIQAAPGTEALPSITFNGGGTSDTDTGIYSLGADDLGFTAGGSIKYGILNGLNRFYANVVVGPNNNNSKPYIQYKNGYDTASTPSYSWYYDNGCGMGHPAGSTIAFSTGSAERLRINNSGLLVSGDISINGNTTAQAGHFFSAHSESRYDKYRMYAGSSAYAIGMYSGNTYGGLGDWAMTFTFNDIAARGFLWRDTSHGTNGGAMGLTTNGKLTVAHSARIGYGETDTTIPGATYRLDVSGSIGATADVVAYISSDKRLKDNIKNIANPLEKLEKLNGVEFDWNDKQNLYKGHDIGVIAQEVEEVLPEIVDTREDGHKAVKYDRMVALLIEAVKEQQQQINKLQEKLNG